MPPELPRRHVGRRRQRERPSVFDFVAGQPSLSVHDANYCFGNVRSGCPPEPYLDAAAEYLLVDGSGQTVDALSQVSGDPAYPHLHHRLSGPHRSRRPPPLDGRAGRRSSLHRHQLRAAVAAFEEIIAGIIARSRVAFSAGSVQADGVFSGNHLYVSVFRPVEDGHWLGTTKKFCVLPDSGTSGCLFDQAPSGRGYVANPRPVDIWTGSNAPEANAGGTGQIMLEQSFG